MKLLVQNFLFLSCLTMHTFSVHASEEKAPLKKEKSLLRSTGKALGFIPKSKKKQQNSQAPLDERKEAAHEIANNRQELPQKENDLVGPPANIEADLQKNDCNIKTSDNIEEYYQEKSKQIVSTEKISVQDLEQLKLIEAQHKAATNSQRLVRGFLDRKKAKRIKAAHQAQEEEEKQQERLNQIKDEQKRFLNEITEEWMFGDSENEDIQDNEADLQRKKDFQEQLVALPEDVVIFLTEELETLEQNLAVLELSTEKDNSTTTIQATQDQIAHIQNIIKTKQISRSNLHKAGIKIHQQKFVNLTKEQRSFLKSKKGKKLIRPEVCNKILHTEKLTLNQAANIRSLLFALEAAKEDSDYTSDEETSDDDDDKEMSFTRSGYLFSSSSFENFDEKIKAVHDAVFIDMPRWLLGKFGYLTMQKKLELYKQYYQEKYAQNLNESEKKAIKQALSFSEVDVIIKKMKNE